MLKSNTAEADLGRDPIGPLLRKLALPAILAQVVNLLYNLVDRMYIGHIADIGADALTGVGVCMPVIMAISAFAALVSMGGAPRASIMMGRGDRQQAENILGNCTTLLIVVAVILTLVVSLFGETILLSFGASENTIGYAWQYMQIYALGTLFVQLALGLNAFINAQGFARTGMMTVVIGAACNIVLDPIFIFAFKMGVRGAALATILSQAVSCVWIVWFLTDPHKTHLRIRRQYLKPSVRVFLPCIALGLAPFIMQFTESVLFVCFNTSLLRYGDDIAVGAMTILSSVMQFTMLPLQGLTQGSQPIVSFNFGAGQTDRVKKTFWLLLKCAAVYSCAMWAVCMLAPQVLIFIFTDNAQLAEFTRWAMRIYMAAACIFSVQIACQQTFIALGNSKTSVFLALLRKVLLLIPLIYILPQLIDNQVLAVFLAEPVADIIAVSVTATLFSREYRRLPAPKRPTSDTAAGKN